MVVKRTLPSFVSSAFAFSHVDGNLPTSQLELIWQMRVTRKAKKHGGAKKLSQPIRPLIVSPAMAGRRPCSNPHAWLTIGYPRAMMDWVQAGSEMGANGRLEDRGTSCLGSASTSPTDRGRRSPHVSLQSSSVAAP